MDGWSVLKQNGFCVGASICVEDGYLDAWRISQGDNVFDFPTAMFLSGCAWREFCGEHIFPLPWKIPVFPNWNLRTLFSKYATQVNDALSDLILRFWVNLENRPIHAPIYGDNRVVASGTVGNIHDDVHDFGAPRRINGIIPRFPSEIGIEKMSRPGSDQKSRPLMPECPHGIRGGDDKAQNPQRGGNCFKGRHGMTGSRSR